MIKPVPGTKSRYFCVNLTQAIDTVVTCTGARAAHSGLSIFPGLQVAGGVGEIGQH
jgi:hypothetical protein